MLYTVLKSFIKFGLHWYVSDWKLKNLDYAQLQNPSIIVSNHPNSFFDALVLVAFSPAEIRFLTRGDIFEKPWANGLLRSLYMLPIYKMNDTEEAEIKNAFTIDACIKELKEGNKILIFPEGVSRNKLVLQPFMYKGISMLIDRSIQMDIPIQIQPYVIAYNSFDHVPKSVSLEALSPIDCTNFIEDSKVQTTEILQGLRDKMELSMPDTFIEPDVEYLKNKEWMKIPAQIGGITHQWFFNIAKKWVKKKTEGSIFYDSLLFVVLLFTYPILILLISIILGNIFSFSIGFLVFLILPFLAYCWVQYAKVKTSSQEIEERKNSLNQNP